MSKLAVPELLLIAGQSQNVGKSTLACQIIQQFSRNNLIIGIKTTPHFHKSVAGASILTKTENFSILEETNPKTNKDTSRMLKSGARRAFLIMAEANGIQSALHECLQLIPKGYLIVCESGELINHIKPGVFLYLRQLNCKVDKIDNDPRFSLSDRTITFTTNGFDFSPTELEIANSHWKLQN